MINFGSVCSGIEAASVAWLPLGFTCEFVSEVAAFPSAVLQHHYPDVPNYGDFTGIEKDASKRLRRAIRLIVGGTPCQSFSVAGLREGLADPRGNLALEYLGLVDRLRPFWVVWENVPGVLSSEQGRDFGCILGALGKLGYGWAYRILDAQYFGVPQRRRRVFVVGCLGGWACAAAVLFERHSLSGHPAPRRKAGQRVTGSLASRAGAGGGLGTDLDLDGGVVGCLNSNGKAAGSATQQDAENGMLIARPHAEISPALKMRDHKGVSSDGDGDGDGAILVPMVAHTLRGEGFDGSFDGTGKGTPIVPALVSNGDNHSGYRDEHGLVPIAIQERAGAGNLEAGPGGAGFREDGQAFTLEARTRPQAVAFDLRGRDGGAMLEGPHDTVNIRAGEGGSSRSYIHQRMAVRRLTPRECERLQGFPDDYTLVPYRNKMACDGPRYKALGNSMAVPVMRWIGKRLLVVDGVLNG